MLLAGAFCLAAGEVATLWADSSWALILAQGVLAPAGAAAGSIGVGVLGRHFCMKNLLALLYGSRAVMIAVYLAAPKTETTFYGSTFFPPPSA